MYYINVIFLFQYYVIMWIKHAVLTAIASAAILNWADWCLGIDGWKSQENNLPLTEYIESTDSTKLNIQELKTRVQEDTKKEIAICLETDDPNSYTHTKALEAVTDPRNTVLEYPVGQLFQRYLDNKKPHPLYVSWVAKNFRALTWKGWIESTNLTQKLNARENEITSETKYEIWDTLRFFMIDPELLHEFPEDFSDQLKEEWFETFSDKSVSLKDSLDVDHIYDIVVKSLSSWKSALALYRDRKLFMTSYASVWTFGRQTRTGQFEILWEFPYKRSTKYENSPMPFALNYYWWYYFHQWNVTGRPLSHGCVRLPWVKADILYSAAKGKPTNVFIDKNLYEEKKDKTHTN